MTFRTERLVAPQRLIRSIKTAVDRWILPEWVDDYIARPRRLLSI